MTFYTPQSLLLLILVPLLLLAYLWQLRRKRKNAVRYSNVALIRQAIPRRSRWKRHVPVALFLASIGVLAIAAARPQISEEVPLSRTSIILTLDVSGSMCATDVQPNRLAAAQEAARNFVKDQVAGTRIGLIAFADFAQLLVPPTTNKSQLTDAINNLTTARGTVIGAATLQAIDAIASVNPNVAPVGSDVNPDTGPASPTDTSPNAATITPPKGPFVPDIIVLLTDGANTRGIDPVDAAKQAAQRHIRIYTIGFGTTNPTELACTREQLGAGALDENGFGGGFIPPAAGGGGGPGIRRFLTIDENTLKAVAATTGGQFYRAQDANQLRDVFTKLPSQIELQHQDHEISVLFAIIGGLLAALAVGLSLLWNRYP
jgi:Ca-activated chloride channel family protein